MLLVVVARRFDIAAKPKQEQKQRSRHMNLDWKWIGIGALIMIAMSFVAGFILTIFIAPQLEGVTDPAEIQLSGGQIALAALLNFLAYVVGGFIVGVKSAGRTILEPAIAAAAAVAIALLIAGVFSIGTLIAGGLVPFLAGLLGGWLGERRQESKAGI
jgi:MFS family permease